MEKPQPYRNLFTNKQLFHLLWPVLIEQTLGSLVGLSDTVMVSNVGDVAVSAVGLIDTINNMFINVFNAIATGATVVVAQKFGAGDRAGIKKTVAQSSFVIVAIMIVVCAVVQLFGSNIYSLLYPKVEAAVRDNSLAYFKITALNYPGIALFSVLAGSFRGRGNTRVPLLASICINVVNISLNAVFIFGFGMGVRGAALATLIGWSVGVAIMITATIRDSGRDLFSFANLRPRIAVLGAVFKISLPAGLDTLLFHAGKIIISTFIGGMGTAAISGNTIAGSMFGLICIAGNAFFTVATTVAGQCYGAGLRRAARANMLKCVGYATALLSALGLALYFIVPTLVGFYNPTPGASVYAVSIVRMYLIMIPLFWPSSFVSAGGLRASNDVGFVTIISMISMWLVRVFGAWLLGVKFGLGPVGVNLAMGLDWVFRSLFYMPRIFFLRRFREDVAIEKPAE